MRTPIYLDYAAATPMDRRVTAAMEPYFTKLFYNPSSSYTLAKQVRFDVTAARGRVAHWLGAKPAEVIFTAGATESINLAINGVMCQYPQANIVTLGTEHDAVLAAASRYARQTAPVLPNGQVNLATFSQCIDDNTVLVSVGYANNEIGTIQPLKDISLVVQHVRRMRQLKNNPLPLYIHTDASQAACYLDIHVSRLGVDLLTLNGGKMYGPKQSGVLYVSAGVHLEPLVVGGGQEMGLRSGTENVAACLGLAAALDLAQNQRKAAGEKAAVLRQELLRRLTDALPDTVVNGNPKKCLPHILHVSWPGIDGERLVMLLDEHGVMASTGSACAANKQTASHVLRSLGMGPAEIAGSLRLSVGAPTTQRDIKTAADIIIKAVRALRQG